MTGFPTPRLCAIPESYGSRLDVSSPSSPLIQFGMRLSSREILPSKGRRRHHNRIPRWPRVDGRVKVYGLHHPYFSISEWWWYWYSSLIHSPELWPLDSAGSGLQRIRDRGRRTATLVDQDESLRSQLGGIWVTSSPQFREVPLSHALLSISENTR